LNLAEDDIDDQFSNDEEIIENNNEILHKKPNTVLGIKGGASIRTTTNA
jgi:hypothetical protein